VKKLTQLAEEPDLCTFLVKGRAGERLDKILYQKFKKNVACPRGDVFWSSGGLILFMRDIYFERNMGTRKKNVF
jgi:hypothetical protein